MILLIYNRITSEFYDQILVHPRYCLAKSLVHSPALCPNISVPSCGKSVAHSRIDTELPIRFCRILLKKVLSFKSLFGRKYHIILGCCYRNGPSDSRNFGCGGVGRMSDETNVNKRVLQIPNCILHYKSMTSKMGFYLFFLTFPPKQ